MKSSLSVLRLVALLEGLSLIGLMFIAMPLKYYWDKPHAVQIIGLAHGVLFIIYVVNLLMVHLKFKWSATRTLGAFIAAWIPFGTFYADKKWFREN